MFAFSSKGDPRFTIKDWVILEESRGGPPWKVVFLRLREMRTARQEGVSVKTGSLVGGGRKVH